MDNRLSDSVRGSSRKGDINAEITNRMKNPDCSMLFPDPQAALNYFHELAKKAPETLKYPLPNVIIDPGQAAGSYAQVCLSKPDVPKTRN